MNAVTTNVPVVSNPTNVLPANKLPNVLRSADNRVLPMFGLSSYKAIPEDVASNVKDCINYAELNYEAVKEQALTQDGRPIDGTYYLKRKDNGNILANYVGPNWTPLQNETRMDWFQPYVDSGLFTIVGAGEYGDTVSILAKANLQQNTEIKVGDAVGYYLNIQDFWRQGKATTVQSLIVRLTCLNGAVNREATNYFKLRHNPSIANRLASVKETFENVENDFTKMITQYRSLASKVMKDADFKNMLMEAFQFPQDEKGNVSKRASNLMDKLQVLQYKNPTFEGIRGTWWGGYNAVTHYLTHEYGRGDLSRVQNMFEGASSKIEQRALQYALAV